MVTSNTEMWGSESESCNAYEKAHMEQMCKLYSFKFHVLPINSLDKETETYNILKFCLHFRGSVITDKSDHYHWLLQ